MKNLYLVSIFLLLSLVVFVSAFAENDQGEPPIQIELPGIQTKPRIYSQYIVYEDHRNWTDPLSRNTDIYMYNLLTNRERQITTNESGQDTPDIWGNYIVWEDCRRYNGYNTDNVGELSNRCSMADIYGFNIQTGEEFQITDSYYPKYDPAINGNKVVWAEQRPGYNQFDIMLYDISTGETTQLTPEMAWREEPDIYGNYVVWEQTRQGYTIPDIYLYNLTTGQTQVISSSEIVSRDNPSIYENKVVWAKERPGYNQYDIMLYDISTVETIQLTPEMAWRENPDIYGKYVVWEQGDGQIHDIYLYDLDTGQTQVISPTTQTYRAKPSVFNNAVVWQERDDLMVFCLNGLIDITFPREGQTIYTLTPTIRWDTSGGIQPNENLRLTISHFGTGIESQPQHSSLKSNFQRILSNVVDFFDIQPAYAVMAVRMITDLDVIVPNTGSYRVPEGILSEDINYTLKLSRESDPDINDIVHFRVSLDEPKDD